MLVGFAQPRGKPPIRRLAEGRLLVRREVVRYHIHQVLKLLQCGIRIQLVIGAEVQEPVVLENNVGEVVHVIASEVKRLIKAAPRSGVGLNELLGLAGGTWLARIPL